MTKEWNVDTDNNRSVKEGIAGWCCWTWVGGETEGYAEYSACWRSILYFIDFLLLRIWVWLLNEDNSDNGCTGRFQRTVVKSVGRLIFLICLCSDRDLKNDLNRLGKFLKYAYVVVQFYPWFNFYFLLFYIHCHIFT